MKFAKKWKDEEKPSFHEKIKDKVIPKKPLKQRLNEANKRMKIQIRKLDKAANQFSNRDKSLFKKLVEAYSNHDLVRAKVYANELSEIRKGKRHVLDTMLALEQLSLRLGTVSEFGDVVGMLSPTVSVLQKIGNGISDTMPEAGKELGQIGDLLNGLISESSTGTDMSIDFEAPSDAAQKILDEAAKLAKENIKQQLPEIPVDVPEVRKEEIMT
ncbi:MAG: Snf7 family protein [Candidatus Bathyarchaeota archaeon]